MIFYFLTIITSLIEIRISITLNLNKIKHKNTNNIIKHPTLKTRVLNIYDNYSSIDIPLFKSYDSGLYFIDINIGEPSQKFSLVIDSGSSLLWVYDNKCYRCKAENKFISSDSKTFSTNKERIDLNYISGHLEGYLSQDNMNLNNKIKLPMFYFILVYESNIDFDMDGIIGFSKGNSYRSQYSFLSQLYEKEIIKDNLYIYDFYNKSFYIGEIPSYLEKEQRISCIDSNKLSTFWNCESNLVKFDNISIFMYTKIIFDSGTNGIVFPMKYLDIFKEIIKQNDVFANNGCDFVKEDYDNSIYKFICKKQILDPNVNDMNNTSNNIIDFSLEKNIGDDSDKKSFGFKLEDLLEEDEGYAYSYSLYVFNRKEEILMGAPFFEKYPVMFNKDNSTITIFGKGNKLIKSKKNKNRIKSIILLVLTIIIVILLIIIILVILRNYLFSSKRVKNDEIEKILQQEI